MDEFERIKAAVLAARARLPADLEVADVVVSETTDGDGGEVVRVRLVLSNAPTGGFSSAVYWKVSAVLDEVVRPHRPHALVLPGFITATEAAENREFVSVTTR